MLIACQNIEQCVVELTNDVHHRATAMVVLIGSRRRDRVDLRHSSGLLARPTICMDNIGSITGRRDECTHVTRDIGSKSNGWEPRPGTDLASIEFVDEWETDRKSPVVTRAPKPFYIHPSIHLYLPSWLNWYRPITVRRQMGRVRVNESETRLIFNIRFGEL